MVKKSIKSRRSVFAYTACCAFAALIFFSSIAAPEVSAKDKKKRIDYGRIEITTTPGTYPILIDNQPSGDVNSTVRYLDLAPGRHTLEIDFPNGLRWVRNFDIVAGRKNCVNLNFAPRTVTVVKPPPPPPSPCPYPVNVSAPAMANDGDTIIFASDVRYTGAARLRYFWQVSPSPARILNGQGTSMITVDSTGVGRRRVTATLTVDDGSGDPTCRENALGATNIRVITPPPITPRKFDEFPSVAFNDDKARLDQYAIALQNDPTARGYVFVYRGRTNRPGRIENLMTRTRNYLTATRGINASRLTVINGGLRERDTLEFWIVPPGASEPHPTPNAQPNEARPSPVNPTRRRSGRP